MIRKKRAGLVLVAISVLFLTGFSSVQAAGANFGLGARAGYSSNPDQFVIGGQGVFGKVWQRVRITPSVDLGFGNDVKTIALNFDGMIDLFSPPGSKVVLYGGAGPNLAIYSPDIGDNQTELGVSLIAGMKIPAIASNYYNLEARFGFGDIPDFKILFGYMFSIGG